MIYTMREACRLLKISDKTLAKWVERCHIQPQESPYDHRVRMLTQADIDTLADALNARPIMGRQPDQTLVAVARLRENLATQHVAAPAPLHLVAQIPAGHVTLRSFADRHGIPKTTVERNRHRLSFHTWEEGLGMGHARMTLDEDEQRAFVALWEHHPTFHCCDEARCACQIPITDAKSQ